MTSFEIVFNVDIPSENIIDVLNQTIMIYAM